MPFSPSLVKVLGRQSTNALTLQATKWSRQWGIPSLARDVSIDLNPRLRTAVARCCRDRNLVELGPRFLALRTRKAEVLAHELAHAAVTRLFGSHVRPHGAEWRALVRAVGFIPRIRLVGPCPAVRETVRKRVALEQHFEHRCPTCQMVRVARRRVSGWRCRRCIADGLAGTLVVSRVARP
jgi:predicted SprT family Zn-dependent metalloprotease